MRFVEHCIDAATGNALTLKLAPNIACPVGPTTSFADLLEPCAARLVAVG